LIIDDPGAPGLIISLLQSSIDSYVTAYTIAPAIRIEKNLLTDKNQGAGYV